MATPNDPARLRVGPFTAAQRQRLEALTAATMLVKGRTIWDHANNNRRIKEPALMSDLHDVSQWIVTGDLP